MRCVVPQKSVVLHHSSEFLGLDTQFPRRKSESNVMYFECTLGVTSPYW